MSAAPRASIIPTKRDGGAAAAVKQFLGCDMHKKFSVLVTMDELVRTKAPVKAANDFLELNAYLKIMKPAASVAAGASGGCYWFVDRLEEA